MKFSSKWAKCWFTVVALMFAFGVTAWAQTVTGSIRGTIMDQSGAAVPGATVTAREVATGVVTTTTTDKSGTYNFQSLRIGTYVVSGSKAGFSITKNQAFSLEIDQIAKIDLKLQVGEVTATVDVAANSGSLLQTEDATLGTTITANTLDSMPLSGQNFGSATLFTPGAVNPTYDLMGGGNGTERDTSPSTIPSYNGNRQETNNYIFDGTDINEPLNNVIGYNPAPEEIGQMRVITGNANAEYGNVNGGEIIMVTKQGTNKFHGTLYSYYENQDLTANLWSNNHSNLPKGNFHQNQFGAGIGGPILKNKLFFYADFEGFRNSALSNSTVSVATTRMRSGDFSELLGNPILDPGHNAISSTNQIQLFNTSAGNGTVVPYVNNQIPLLNPVAAYLFTHPEVYPLPNRPVPSADTTLYADYQNYQGTAQSAIVNNQGDVRVDYILSSRDNIWARGSHGDAYDLTVKPVLPITFPSGDEYPYYGGVINEVHTFTTNLQNEFRAGFSRVAWQQGEPVDRTGEFGTSGDAKLGWNLPNQPYQGFSLVSLTSVESNVGTKAAATVYYDNVFDYGDTVTWLHGKHIVKGGAQVLRYQENNYYPSTNGNLGEFSYSGAYTANANASSATYPGKHTGWGFADWVLDKSNSQGIAAVTGRFGQRQYRLAFFAEDEWKITPTFTANIGLRYGYDQPMYEVNNKEVNIDVKNPQNCPNCIQFAGQNGNSRALYNSFYKEFMPRVSFAWQMHPNMVLRGGYGITDDMEGTGANLRLTQNAPFLVSYSNTGLTPTATSPGSPVSVSQGFTVGSVAGSSTRYQAWDPNLKPALIQQFNLTLQVIANSHTTVQAGYVGQLGQHLVIPENINQYTTPGVASTAPFAKLVGTGGIVYYTTAEGYSNYNALQAQIRQQLSHGLEYTFNYTWSKALTNNPGFYGVSGVDGAGVFLQNIYNPHGDYGPAGYDTRNAVNFVASYAIPFGHGRDYGAKVNRFVDWAIGGWKVSGDAIMYSGFPVTISSTNLANANAGAARANQYQPIRVNHRTLTHWFGTDPTATPCTGPNNGTCAYGPEITNSYGTARVGTERAPGYRIIDMSAFKDFRTYKEQFLEFRADAFNAFNIASYAAPGSAVTSPASFGLITSTLSPARQYEFALKYKF